MWCSLHSHHHLSVYSCLSDASIATWFLADRTSVRSLIGSWHDTVVCLSVCNIVALRVGVWAESCRPTVLFLAWHPVAAICHKSWGSRSEATSLPSSILLFSSLSWTPQGVWAEPAHPLPNNLMQFMQSNSFIKST